MNKKEKNGSKVVTIISIVLVVFLLICILAIISTKQYHLISALVGIVALIVTMNIANIIRVPKEKIKLFSIISIALSLIAAILLFKQVIYSLALSVPAVIIAKKAINKDSRQVLAKIAFVLSIITVLACFVTCIVRLIELKNLKKLLKG